MAFLIRAFARSTGNQVPGTEMEKHSPVAAIAYAMDLRERFPDPKYAVRVMHTSGTSEDDFSAFHDLAAANGIRLEPAR